MIAFYRDGLFPLYWGDEQSGILGFAMRNFIETVGIPEGFRNELPQDQFELVRDYLVYVVKAPCWSHSDVEAFSACVRKLEGSATAEQLWKAAYAFLEFGIDPI